MDRDRQRAATRERVKRYRERQKGVTGATDVTLKSGTDVTTLPAHFGQPDCQCQHCRQNRRAGSPLAINHGPYKKAEELATGEVNRVSLPGDPDYKGVVNPNAPGSLEEHEIVMR